MAGHRQVHVIVIEGVARRAIDQRSRQRRQPRSLGDDGGLRRAAGLVHLVNKQAHQRIGSAGQRDPVIIKDALAGQRAHTAR